MNFDSYCIRLIKKDDLEAYYNLIESNRKRLESFFAGIVIRTQTLEATKIYFNEVLKKVEDKIYFPYFVIDTNTQKIIALVDLKNIDWNIPKGELGCFVAKNNIATKAQRHKEN